MRLKRTHPGPGRPSSSPSSSAAVPPSSRTAGTTTRGAGPQPAGAWRIAVTLPRVTRRCPRRRPVSERTTVVLVHGAMHSARSWDRVVAELDRRDVPARAIDLPGRGSRAGWSAEPDLIPKALHEE